MEIKTKLTLRSSLYNQPTDTIQKVLLMVEQAKGATDDTFRGTVLAKAASILGLAEDPNAAAIAAAAGSSPKSAAARSDDEGDAEAGVVDDADLPEKPNSVERLQRTLLCSDIMALMWELGETKVRVSVSQTKWFNLVMCVCVSQCTARMNKYVNLPLLGVPFGRYRYGRRTTSSVIIGTPNNSET